ncbi:MAG: hypothetical protein DME11_17915, partial [Candidatus Rokuibacteriota bacterium]
MKPVEGASSTTMIGPTWKTVLWSMVTSAAALRIWKTRASSVGGVVTSSKTLSRIRIRFVCWLGALESSPRMPTPPPTWRRMLWVKVTSWTTLQGAMTSSLRTVKRIAKPICAAGQTCSKTLPS